MKYFIKTLCLMAVLLSLPVSPLFASEARVDGGKEGKMVFSNVKKGGILNLTNSFGNITLVPWDKPEIVLEYKISVSAKDKTTVDKILSSIEIIKEEAENKYALTMKNEYAVGGEHSLESTWTVNVPKDLQALAIQNRFGNVFIPDYDCESLKTSVQFVSFKARD